MRPIPEEIIHAIRAESRYHESVTSASLRRLYKQGQCHSLALALCELYPLVLRPWVLSSHPYEDYDAFQDWLSVEGGELEPAPMPVMTYGHAFAVVQGTRLALDIEGLRPIKQMQKQFDWHNLDYNFPIQTTDMREWTAGQPDFDRLVAEALFTHNERLVVAAYHSAGVFGP